MRRRVLLAAALAIPVLVWAAATAPTGQLIEVNHYDGTIPASYIGAAACAGTASLNVEWNVNTTVSTNGTYRIFASNTDPSTMAAPNTGFCAEQSVSGSGTTINAGQIGGYSVTSAVQDASDLSAQKAVSTAGQSCTEGAIVFICAHYYDQNATRQAVAWGKFIVQVTAPSDPTGVSATAGNGKLSVSWTASSGGATVDHYVAEAFLPTQDITKDTPVATSTTNGASTSTTITGLANGTTYTVVVVAYSKGGNASGLSGTASGTPVETADFWTVYKDRGGQEQGGCGSGPGGALALLGVVAALAALRRRNP